MENRNQSSPPPGPDGALAAIEARLTALEQRIAEGAAPPATASGEPSPDSDALSDELARQRDQLRDYEKALVERIADVDDDRRATAARLRRAWQNQLQEVDARLRGQVRFAAAGALLLVLLFAGALFLVHRGMATVQAQLAAEVEEVRGDLARLSTDGVLDESLAARLAALKAQVGEIASALGELDSGPPAAERTAREEAEGRFADDIRRLAAEQKRLAAAVEALQSPPGPAASPKASPEASPTASTVDPASAATGQAADSAAAATPSRPVGAPVVTTTDDEGTEILRVAGGGLYGLQLIGYFSRESLVEFASRDGLPSRLFYLRQSYKGRPWFVLIHSLHDNTDKAAAALAALPPDLAALDPWIRPLTEGTELRILERGPQDRAAEP